MSKEAVFFAAQRKAFETLNVEKVSTTGENKQFKVNPNTITSPAVLQQELQLTTDSNIMTFQFGTKAPASSNVLNNTTLGDNDICVIYGIQMLLGEGATANTRLYRAYGPNLQDNVPYNGKLGFQLESNLPVANIDALQMRREHGTDKDQFDGAMVINPQRIVSGRVSTFNVVLTMPPVTGLIFTSNLFVSMRLLTALAQATAL